MQKNHSRKSHSKKNRYYKNVKEHKNMGKIEGTTEFIMMNRQVAHEKMCAIVKSMFEMAELDTDYINQPPYQSFVERFFGQFNNEPQLFCDKVLTSDRCFDALDRVLTSDKEFAEVYNGLSYDDVGVGRSRPYFVGSNEPLFVGKLGANRWSFRLPTTQIGKLFILAASSAQRPLPYRSVVRRYPASSHGNSLRAA